MITRLYAHNFRCLVAFETSFESFGLLCGPNGAGKSSVFDALRLIRDLATGDAYLGGDGDRDIRQLEFTNWLRPSGPLSRTSSINNVQEFELGVTAGGHIFKYTLHIEQKANDEKPRILKESAVCDGKNMFDRDLAGVKITRTDGTQTGFPLDWRQAALASIEPSGNRQDIVELQKALAKLLILRPDPRGMKAESKQESVHPDVYLSNLISWYRSLYQDMEWATACQNLLQDVWPDFRFFRLVDVGLNVKALQLKFGEGDPLFFDQLSDGEKALVGLYMVRAALSTGAAQTVLIDEPDNFVGLPELQPWVLSMRELLDENHQTILISHHPEIVQSAGEESGRYLWRDNHSSPTRIGPLSVPQGVNAGEAFARGWIRA